MHIGYIIAIAFAVIWIGFKIVESVRKNQKLREGANKVVETVKQYDTDIDDLIL